MLEGRSERSISRTCVLYLPVCCGVFFQLKEQEPRFSCGCPLLPPDAASSPGLLAHSGAVLRLLPLPGGYLSWFGLPMGDGHWQSCSCRKG